MYTVPPSNIRSRLDDLLEALDAPNGLSGAALDVTDPEPLPNGHPLYTHPGAIVTGHTSGSFANYCEAGADILIAQLKRLKQGQGVMNVVDPEKGY
jgi:phosphoglycerate dehydrogenase-like enzyme